MSICRNCKYFVPNKRYNFSDWRFKEAYCKHPALTTIDCVTGIPSYRFAKDLRHAKEFCGKEAIRFEEERNVVAKKWRDLPEPVKQMLCFYILIMVAILKLFARQ